MKTLRQLLFPAYLLIFHTKFPTFLIYTSSPYIPSRTDCLPLQLTKNGKVMDTTHLATGFHLAATDEIYF